MSNGVNVVSQDRKDDQGSGDRTPSDSEVRPDGEQRQHPGTRDVQLKDTQLEDTQLKDTQPRDARPREEVAREIGASRSTGAKAGGKSGSARRELEDGGPLRLDKSGALAGRQKLKPVKAHKKSADRAGSQPAPSEELAAADEPLEISDASAVAKTPARDPRPSARPRKASLPPKLGTLRPEGAAAKRAEVETEVSIPAGSFLYGEDKTPRENAAFQMDRAPVTNADYELFVTATGHRPALYWAGASAPAEIAVHPVVGVDYYDALAYARWKGKDLPFEDEWERAVRGTDGRTYPWGDDQELSGANTARVGLRMTVPFDLHRENVSPEGCRDMVGNAWEITHSPAPGGGVVVRGGSWYDFALYAKTFFRFASQPDARNGTIGFRCCRRPVERPEATYEVDPALVDAEIAARRGGAPPVDAGSWSAERRDLVIDMQRLRTFVAEARAEALLGASVVKPPRPVLRTVEAVSRGDLPPGGVAAEEGTVTPAPEPTPAPQETEAKSEPKSAPVSLRSAPSQGVPPAKAPPEKAPPKEEPAAARIHVGSPTTSAASSSARGASPAWERAAGDAVRAEKKAKTVARPGVARSMPLTMWVLLGAGFLLFGGLLVVLVNLSDENPEPVSYLPDAYVVDPVDDERRSPLADLPDMPPYDAFPWSDEPPRVIDMADRIKAARLDSGLWVLVFVEPEGLGAGRTIQTAHAMHRRMAASDVNVAVVLPRTRYETNTGALFSQERMAERLKADGSRSEGGNFLWDGIPVVLEPVDGSGRGLLRLRTGSPETGVATVLLNDGQLETRLTPVAEGYTEASLVGLARRALEIQAAR